MCIHETSKARTPSTPAGLLKKAGPKTFTCKRYAFAYPYVGIF